MDFIREFDAFMERQLEGGVSSAGVCLWNAILYLLNENHYPETLKVAENELMNVSGLSRPKLLKALDELTASGNVACSTQGYVVTFKMIQMYPDSVATEVET